MTARWCRWAKRAWAVSGWTTGSGAHRQEPDPLSTNRSKEATMMTKLAALALLCLMTGSAMAEEPRVTPLMTKDLAGDPGKEVLMITVEHVPGGSSVIHRHNAQAFVY